MPSFTAVIETVSPKKGRRRVRNSQNKSREVGEASRPNVETNYDVSYCSLFNCSQQTKKNSGGGRRLEIDETTPKEQQNSAAEPVRWRGASARFESKGAATIE